MKKYYIFAYLFLFLIPITTSIYAREVLSWVPPYSVNTCYTTLNADFGAYSPKNVMTGLGLQFWRPTSSGGLVYEIDVDDDDVNKFREKCTEYGIKLLLCVYNNNQQDPGWDWNLASSAFRNNRTNFVNALYDECKRLNLDGVDIDLEGLGGHDDDRQAFALFIIELGEKLHAEGLWLTVDSFHSPCYNAPNMAWWEDWVGYVDYIHSMGYAALWENNNETLNGCPSDPDEEGNRFFKYSYQSQYGLDAGLSETVVSVGMPSSSSWGDGYVEDHLLEVINLDSPTGICIWDFTLEGSRWQQSATWELAKRLVDLDSGNTEITLTQSTVQPQKYASVSMSKSQIQLTVTRQGLYTVSLYNASGQLYQTVGKKDYFNGVHILPVSYRSMANGVYFIKISGDKGTMSQKIVVSH